MNRTRCLGGVVSSCFIGSCLISGCLLILGTPTRSAAQETSPSTSATGTSRDVLRTLPVLRLMGAVPPVRHVGAVPRRDGTLAHVPLTAAYALSDLKHYAEQLHSLYPPSGLAYPTDSLAEVQRIRAAAWVDRLRGLVALNDVGVTGWQLVPYAEIAAWAGNDSLARRLFDARLAELGKSPPEQSYVLSVAIGVFSDPAQDPARLNCNLLVAEQYAAVLHAMPGAGFRTHHRMRNDSTSALYRQEIAAYTLMMAYEELGTMSPMLTHAERAVVGAARLAPQERLWRLLPLYRAVAIAAAEHPQRGQPDALAHQTLASARVRSPGGADDAPEVRARRHEQIVRDVQRGIDEVNTTLSLIGRSAPPLPAHVWLNTPDSVYRADPRTRTFSDGVVRLLLFADIADGDRLAVLDRMQRQFPRGFEGILVTATTGHVGPDLVDPAEEVRWFRRYVLDVRHFANVVALWAGSKVSYETGLHGKMGVQTVESPVDQTEYLRRGDPFVLIDGHGIIRSWSDVTNRALEAKLTRRIAAVLARSGSAAQPSVVPTN